MHDANPRFGLLAGHSATSNSKPRGFQVNWWARTCALLIFSGAAASVLAGQDFSTLFNFNGTDGAHPLAGLVRAGDGNFYGTTFGEGGSSGTVFRLTPGGVLTTMYNFCAKQGCADGSNPSALIQGRDGNLYGTTGAGGFTNAPCKAYGCGTVFRITPGGRLTTLHTFVGTDGMFPEGLVQANDGNFYGTAYQGGVTNLGAIFRITPGGSFTTLYNFCPETGCADGAGPYAALVQATDGDLYGVATYGGGNDYCFGSGCGTVFKITLGGTLTTLYRFCSQDDCVDGAFPYSGLVQAANGKLYGTTLYGGLGGGCSVTGVPGCGTVFEMSMTGQLATLHSFCSESACRDGDLPYGSLLQGTDGNFYGSTGIGGTSGKCEGGCGTLFELTRTGLSTLMSFDSTNGAHPYGAIIQDTSGRFYGTAYSGGESDDGVVFGFSPARTRSRLMR
jgi:uncharacterized repeat protein (TIGR03803 family)